MGMLQTAILILMVLGFILPADSAQMTIRYKDGTVQRINLDGPASGIIQINITEEEYETYQTYPGLYSGRITVISGTYGQNCGALYGNKTRHLSMQCNGKHTCSYRIDVALLGDPSVGCEKDYVAEWRCGSGQLKSLRVPAEAGRGSVITLTCP